MKTKYMETNSNKLMTVGNFDIVIIEFESILVESTKRKYDKASIPENVSQLKVKKRMLRNKLKETYKLSVEKFFKKDRQIKKSILYMENLLQKFRNEFRDLMPLDGRYSLLDDDNDRIEILRAMIPLLEDIIEVMKKNDDNDT